MAIPDPELRAHALSTLQTESFSALGAALVATTADRHDPALVRSLIALQIAWDYIDTLAEQPGVDPVANGVQLHRALVDAVSAGPPRGDYYRLNHVRDDGGYLAALVASCREACATLPAYACVRAAALRELRTAEVQYVNHGPPANRVGELQRWAATQDSGANDASWIELAAAASSSLGVLALLATAADPATTVSTVARVQAAYAPWVDALTALLDSVVDRPADTATGYMNWVSHYPSDAMTLLRLQQITLRAVQGVRELPHGERHVVIVVGMIAMHLSQPVAWLPESQATTRAVLRAADTAAMPFLLLLLRTWRWARAQRARRQSAGQGEPALPERRPAERPPAPSCSV